MTVTWPLKFGSFISPVHSPREDPNLTLHQDVDLCVHLDDLGYDEVWMGEHHSTGWEYVASPELFLSYVAAKTRRIKLGTGVISLPYHHPFNVAERVLLLDHLSRGRMMFGFGPGALAYDAYLYGMHSNDLRPRMEQSLDVVLPLLRGERVSKTTDWFTLRDAKCQLRPYAPDGFEIAVTCTTSPSGPKLAGRNGLSMLTLNATQVAGISALSGNWSIAEEVAAENGQTLDRRNWRLVGPMHIAETEAQARKDVAHGLPDWIYYNTKVGTLGLVPETATTTDQYVDALNENGFAIVGTPDQAAAQIERLWDQSGGFGTFLFWAHDWADREATRRSYELFARYVAPRFKGHVASLAESEAHALRHRGELAPQAAAARKKVTDEYAAQKAAKAS
ncbi:LLM class flavin-dependent oxidoreductase [Mesobacterium pallidum]|uniref:LLM class flavin-dependent oxidoreductase n=1 Tax=Mesobacterium pallidum TaxID=2872037 RepID=UPI001EE25C1C|nr:LLM class flavin-dependent oxidoreductase [Mesobacterium pallidum]